MAGTILVATWTCLGLNRVPCDAGGTGDPDEVDRAADRHTNGTRAKPGTGHGTVTHQRLVKEPDGP
jgi:hypothetical protein